MFVNRGSWLQFLASQVFRIKLYTDFLPLYDIISLSVKWDAKLILSVGRKIRNHLSKSFRKFFYRYKTCRSTIAKRRRSTTADLPCRRTAPVPVWGLRKDPVLPVTPRHTQQVTHRCSSVRLSLLS